MEKNRTSVKKNKQTRNNEEKTWHTDDVHTLQEQGQPGIGQGFTSRSGNEIGKVALWSITKNSP